VKWAGTVPVRFTVHQGAILVLPDLEGPMMERVQQSRIADSMLCVLVIDDLDVQQVL
jgi:hypothetical protein